MSRKGLKVWFLGSLTFLSALFTLEAFLWLTNNTKLVLLNLLPFTDLLGPVNPMLYLIGTLITTLLLWGATATVALHNPLENFLGKVIEDGKKENEAETEFLETKTSILEMFSDTLNENTKSLASLKDLTQNIRTEVVNLRPLREELENLKTNLTYLNKSIKRLQQNMSKRKLCPACGRKVSEKFRLCPFCGENLLKLPIEAIASSPIAIAKKTK